MRKEKLINYFVTRAMVVAQLTERSLPEIHSLNPDIGNISNVFICQLLSRKDENIEKEAGNGPIFKRFKILLVVSTVKLALSPCIHLLVGIFDRDEST